MSAFQDVVPIVLKLATDNKQTNKNMRRLTQIIVAASLSVASAILDESALSFLGYGVALPKSSWGSMLQNAQQYILYDPLLALIPGAFILLTVLCLNILGDVLQHALDPRLHK